MIANKIADASGFEPHGSLVSEATYLPKCDTTTALDSVWDLFLKKNKPTPASFSFIFSLFKQTSLHVSVHFWFNKTVCVKAKFTFGLKFISIFLQKKKKNIFTILTTNICWKNVHPVNGAGIQTHDLWNVSLFPLPLDQGSRPINCKSLAKQNVLI